MCCVKYCMKMCRLYIEFEFFGSVNTFVNSLKLISLAELNTYCHQKVEFKKSLVFNGSLKCLKRAKHAVSPTIEFFFSMLI